MIPKLVTEAKVMMEMTAQVAQGLGSCCLDLSGSDFATHSEYLEEIATRKLDRLAFR